MEATSTDELRLSTYYDHLQQEITDLKQLITLSQKQSNDTNNQVITLEQQVNKLEQQQRGLIKEYEKRQRIIEEQKMIERVQETKVFYDTIRLKLAEVFLAAKVLIIKYYYFDY